MKKPDLHDAVLSSYPDVVTLQGNEANKIIAYNINNQKVTIDPNVVILKLSTMLSEYQTFLLNKDEIKKSAIAKLTALGLTTDEIAHLIT